MRCRMVTFSMTLTYLLPGFQGHGIFEVEYLKCRAFCGQSCYRTLIGNHTQSIEWYNFNDLEWPLTRISRSQHFWSRISEKQRQSYDWTRWKRHNKWNGTVFGDLDWPLSPSRGFVSISWASCLLTFLRLYLQLSCIYIHFTMHVYLFVAL